jgi:hypothetical protein
VANCGGRAGGDLLQSGGIRRERHQVRQDQQDALALRNRADGRWIGDDAHVLGAAPLASLATSACANASKPGCFSSAMMTGWPGWPPEFSEAAITISLPR